MAKSNKRQQKNRAKKKAKRVAKQKRARRSTHQSSARNECIREGLCNPIADCLVNENEGMLGIYVIRPVDPETVLLGGFTVDMWCLGVKDCMLRLGGADQVEALRDDLEPISPADAKKAILGAVAYAEELGFTPAKGFSRAFRILDGVEEADSGREFVYGDKEGKPCFVAGPFDSPEKCRRIVAQLEKHCGEGNFHFLVPFGEEFDYDNNEWVSNRGLREEEGWV